MPEYVAPGVYVEETSFRPKAIEGVPTSIAGFVGPTRYGPAEPELVTSLLEFEQLYGYGGLLAFSHPAGTDEIHNYQWDAVRAFFEEGGKRLYISRIFRTIADIAYARPDFGAAGAQDASGHYVDGHARRTLTSPAGPIRITARFPGAAGNMRVRVTLRAGPNVLGTSADGAPRVALVNHDVVVIRRAGTSRGECYEAQRFVDRARRRVWWRFVDADGMRLDLGDLRPHSDPAMTDVVRVVTATVAVTGAGTGAVERVWEGLALHPKHARAGTPDSICAALGDVPSVPLDARTLPIVITAARLHTGLTVFGAIRASAPLVPPPLEQVLNAAGLSVEYVLEHGNDGMRPKADDYRGVDEGDAGRKTGLVAFEAVEDISIVAAPGSTFAFGDPTWQSEGRAIVGHLVAHAERMRYRIVLLDGGESMTPSDIRAMRATLESSYAALYYPWLLVSDPATGLERAVPPSGFVAGIYARSDIARGVYKAPGNEDVRSASGVVTALDRSQLDALNAEGISCIRVIEGRGIRLWGVRTVSADPEWKYVNVRRYFAYLERSIDRGTQWAVFEPNGPELWASVRRAIEDFLLEEWKAGALVGDTPGKAFFVRCDRTTMTQNDLDNGRLVCLVGVAPLRPAEFVIFRVGQWTAGPQG